MAITEQAPYAPADSLIRVIETYRDTGLGGGEIDTIVLGRMGFGDEISRRIVQALKILELIDDAGKATDNLVAFKQAGDDYKAVLANIIYDVYAPVFAVTGRDLSNKDTAQIEHAFRTFKPDSLRKRMVTLFVGLCEYTGISTPTKGKPGPKSIPAPPKKAGQPKKSIPRPPVPSLTPPPTGREVRHVVDLRSGGRVGLAVDVDLFELSNEDREFVIGLVDKVKGYAGRRMLPATQKAEDTGQEVT